MDATKSSSHSQGLAGPLDLDVISGEIRNINNNPTELLLQSQNETNDTHPFDLSDISLTKYGFWEDVDVGRLGV